MKKKVLIVEDNEDIIFSLKFFLECAGFEVINSEPLTKKEQVISMLKYYEPDAILLDHDLGEKENGLDIGREIANLDKLILSTSTLVSTSEELVGEYKKIGVKHFCKKMADEVKKCLEGRCDCLPS